MNYFNLDVLTNNLYEKVSMSIVDYGPKILGALLVIIIGAIISLLIYKFVIYLFKKFKLIQLIDKLTLEDSDEDNETNKKHLKEIGKKHRKLLSQKIKINIIVAKAASYYIFLVFFRLAIIIIGITEVEKFMGDLLAYLPKLFLGIVILFFGIRFASFIYDIIYHALDLAKQKTAKIIASGAKIIILFFTLMVALHYIDIVDKTIINTILIGFISMLTLAGGIAFGLGGKHVAKEILENLKK